MARISRLLPLPFASFPHLPQMCYMWGCVSIVLSVVVVSEGGVLATGYRSSCLYCSC
jgi:hypothetical protein